MEEVYCELKYSGVAEAFLALAVGATLALVVFVPFADWARALLFGWVVAAAWHARGRITAVRAIKVDREGGFAVMDASGAWRAGALRPGSFVAPWLTVVRWRPDGARFDRTTLLLPGMAGAMEFRRIRAILRWS